LLLAVELPSPAPHHTFEKPPVLDETGSRVPRVMQSSAERF